MVYEGEPDPERYAEHAELCRKVPGATFRHGRIFGSPSGEPDLKYYAEFEFPDRDAFNAAASLPEFGATATDAMKMGVPFRAYFANVE